MIALEFYLYGRGCADTLQLHVDSIATRSMYVHVHVPKLKLCEPIAVAVFTELVDGSVFMIPESCVYL